MHKSQFVSSNLNLNVPKAFRGCKLGKKTCILRRENTIKVFAHRCMSLQRNSKRQVMEGRRASSLARSSSKDAEVNVEDVLVFFQSSYKSLRPQF